MGKDTTYNQFISYSANGAWNNTVTLTTNMLNIGTTASNAIWSGSVNLTYRCSGSDYSRTGNARLVIINTNIMYQVSFSESSDWGYFFKSYNTQCSNINTNINIDYTYS